MIVFLDQSGQLGGAELCLAETAAAMAERSRVTLLAGGPFVGHLENRGVAVAVCPLPEALSRLGKGLSFKQIIHVVPIALGYLRKLRSAISDAHLLYFNTPKALLLGSVAAAFGRAPRIFHLHDLLVPEHFSSLNIRLIVAAANRCQRVIANSRATAEAYKKAGGRAEVDIIPNGFDLALFWPIDEARIQKLRLETTANPMILVGIFGRLSPWKGQHLLLEAAKVCQEIQVVIVGDALFTKEDEEYAEKLREMAAESELEGRVFFLGFRTDVIDLMQAMDIVVHCSTAPEPFGRVIVEAMLAGRPVIASRGGGPSEIVAHGYSGLLFDPDRVSSLIDNLRRLIDSPQERREIAINGKRSAVDRFGLQAILQQTNKIVTEMLL